MIEVILIVVVGSIYVFLGVVLYMLRTRLSPEEADQYRIPFIEGDETQESAGN